MRNPALPSCLLGVALLVAPAGQRVDAPASAAGNAPSRAPDVSSNGRYVAFASDASNLVAGDSNGKPDIFLRDVVGKTTRLVTWGGGAGGANGASTSPEVSDDGRFVTFASDASNLVPGDTNGTTDIFSADMINETITRVSSGLGGRPSNGPSTQPRMSADGTMVLFASAATNLVKGDTNQVVDIFLRDLVRGTTRRLSTTPQNNQNLGRSREPALSSDGTVAAWIAPSGLHEAVYRWDRSSGSVTLVSNLWFFREYAVVRASTAGPSWSDNDYDGHVADVFLQISSLPEGRYSIGSTQEPLMNFDVSRSGSLVALGNPDRNSVEVRGASTADLWSPPMASLDNRRWDDVALASGGEWVVGTDHRTGQVQRWHWRTGTLITVSVT